ncbi:protein of unknown function [Shinella sp. WSC3-e]|nr:protein of unknown function [Shinella sp. WSC3-e]
MKAPPNRYHCASSQALDDVLKTFRTTAFPALTSTAIRISQPTAFPIFSVITSMSRLKASSAFMRTPPRLVCYCFGAKHRQSADFKARFKSAARFSRPESLH